LFHVERARLALTSILHKSEVGKRPLRNFSTISKPVVRAISLNFTEGYSLGILITRMTSKYRSDQRCWTRSGWLSLHCQTRDAGLQQMQEDIEPRSSLADSHSLQYGTQNITGRELHSQDW